MDHAEKIKKRKRFYFLLILIFTITVICLKFCGGSRTKAAPEKKIFPSPLLDPVPSSSSDQLIFPGVVRKGGNLSSILSGEMLELKLISEIIQKTGEIYDLRRIKAGNSYSISYDAEGFLSFRYDIDKNIYLRIFRSRPGSVVGEVVLIPYEVRIELLEGSIDGSLYETLAVLEKNGGELAEHLATLYEYDIDFNRDIRKGDSFQILLEKKYLNGHFSDYGRIIASEFTNRGKKTGVVRFAAEPGKSSYYHPDGKAVKKMFLRCPLPFMRLTSSFGYRRHPVTGFSAAHKGIDLGAPRGTIVRATASGRVIQTGYDPVRGRYIILSHGNRYRTHYYHLSGIKKGIGRGVWVAQGIAIGNVGNTGRSTGPHLHYGLQRSGNYINPLRLNSPSQNPVKQGDIERFNKLTRAVFALMDIGKSSIINTNIKQILYRTVLYLIGSHI